MVAVLGGLGAALCWATRTLAATRASRLAAPPRVLAWVMLVGFAVVAPLVGSARADRRRRRPREQWRDGECAAADRRRRARAIASYSVAARHSIAVAAVLASQFATVAIVGSFVLFRERLRALQVAGVVAVAVCVAILTAVRA